mmetsp:Transcript_57047/g.77829  ORF Transcript_57047/g.77829 Transcript_57047/m.77829 type:complete len:98 (+) Transcript_57047:1614-1907(+)
MSVDDIRCIEASEGGGLASFRALWRSHECHGMLSLCGHCLAIVVSAVLVLEADFSHLTERQVSNSDGTLGPCHLVGGGPSSWRIQDDDSCGCVAAAA